MTSPPADLDLLLSGLRLKHVPRAGWQRVGIHSPESVAAHSWGMGWLVLCLCRPPLDLARCLALATLHDLPEVVVGDITPHDGISKHDKHTLEARAAADLLEDRPELLALVDEYAARHTPEARFVRDLDKLDMALQAWLYRDLADTREFVASALAGVESETVRDLVAALHTRLG